MKAEKSINLREGNTRKRHELCEIVFERLATMKDAGMKSILEIRIVEINRVLLKIDSNRLQGINVAKDVEQAIALLDGIVKEIDNMVGNASEDKEHLELIRSYADQVWRTYIQKIPIS